MEKYLPWLTLKSVPGIGNHLFKRLIEQFQTPEQVLQAPQEELLAVEGVNTRTAAAVKTHCVPAAIKQELVTARQKGYQIITMNDSCYPCLLHQIPDPPPYLYVYGALSASEQKIAVVGSRNATLYGLRMTKRLSQDLAARGITIISGLASGIDTAAHMGALNGHGKTIAVLGSGLDNIYPRENRSLFHKIAQNNGAVVSEFPLRAEPEAHHFPIRNRIISGMSAGTIIVEATKRSGSLITARLAAEQNREVFAVPGSIQSFKSTGTHHLLKQGAKLVEHAQDVLDELPQLNCTAIEPLPLRRPDVESPLTKLSADEALVYATLEPYQLHIDDLVRKTALEPGKLASILLNLELKGAIDQAPGKLFSIREVLS